MSLKAKSKTYAPNESTGAHFEHSISGAAERLLSRLADLVEFANKAEQTILEKAEKGSSKKEASS